MDISNRATILGCGNGGMALAADLKQQGIEVAIWSDPQHKYNMDKILKNNSTIQLHEKDEIKTSKIDLLTNNLEKAIQFSDVIYNCTPMMAHLPLFKKILPCINEKIKILINLSGLFSSVEQLLNTQNRSIYRSLKVFDTSSFPYACRSGESNNVYIYGRKSQLAIAPLFNSDTIYLKFLPKQHQPTIFKMVENPFKLGLMGTNAILHPATALFNARLIDKGISFEFYKEGISPKTSLLHEALDNERLLLAKIMGYKIPNCAEEYSQFYNGNYKDIYDLKLTSVTHNKIQSPSTLNHRFITEDISYCLLPLITLGQLYDLKLPNIESLITIFSTVMNTNFSAHGRNLEGLTKPLIEVLSFSDCIPS